jgi:hypothetical protein
MTQLAEIQSSLLTGKASRRYQPRGGARAGGYTERGFLLESNFLRL